MRRWKDGVYKRSRTLFGCFCKKKRYINGSYNEKEIKLPKIKVYSDEGFFTKFSKFLTYKVMDLYKVIKFGKPFSEYGMTLFVGDQGSGKSMAMTEELERLRKMYPNVLIVTNYGYAHQNHEFTDWNDFFKINQKLN